MASSFSDCPLVKDKGVWGSFVLVVSDLQHCCSVCHCRLGRFLLFFTVRPACLNPPSLVRQWRAMGFTVMLSLLYVAVPTGVLATVLCLLLRSARRMEWPFGNLRGVPLDRLDQQLDVYMFVFWTSLNLNALVLTTVTIVTTWPNSQRYAALNGVVIAGKRTSLIVDRKIGNSRFSDQCTSCVCWRFAWEYAVS